MILARWLRVYFCVAFFADTALVVLALTPELHGFSRPFHFTKYRHRFRLNSSLTCLYISTHTFNMIFFHLSRMGFNTFLACHLPVLSNGNFSFFLMAVFKHFLELAICKLTDTVKRDLGCTSSILGLRKDITVLWSWT